MEISGINRNPFWSYLEAGQIWRGRAGMTAELRQQNAVAHNVANLLSYRQTQDSWASGIQNAVGRMTELAVLANDYAKNASELNGLQAEFDQLQQYVRNVTTGPYAMGQFNGSFLFQA